MPARKGLSDQAQEPRWPCVETFSADPSSLGGYFKAACKVDVCTIVTQKHVWMVNGDIFRGPAR